MQSTSVLMGLVSASLAACGGRSAPGARASETWAPPAATPPATTAVSPVPRAATEKPLVGETKPSIFENRSARPRSDGRTAAESRRPTTRSRHGT